ncbi:MAG: hypothetical protein RL141_1150 [Candidatus Parcubacteria bacterium]|jgi:transcriptional regulator with XRE-family HTH domain
MTLSNELEALQISLRELREMAGYSQKQVAERIQTPQSQVSRIESRQDHLVSTLRKYVEAVGGELQIHVILNGEKYILQNV